MFKKTTITITFAAIAAVAVNLQAPVFAAEPSIDPIITETPGLPGIDSYTFTIPTAEVTLLPDDVLAAITDPMVDLPGLVEVPPLTIDDEEPPIDELVCGEPGAICDEPDEGAELPLDPTDVCGDEGTACDFDTSGGESGAASDEHPWDVPLGDDEEAPFDDDGWVEPDHDEESSATAAGTDSSTAATQSVTTTTATQSVTTTTATQSVTTTTATPDAATIDDSIDAAISETSEAVADVTPALTAAGTDSTDDGIDPAVVAVAGILALMAVAGIGYGAFRMGRNGG